MQGEAKHSTYVARNTNNFSFHEIPFRKKITLVLVDEEVRSLLVAEPKELIRNSLLPSAKAQKVSWRKNLLCSSNSRHKTSFFE